MPFTKLATDVFAPTTGGGASRQVDNAEVQTWGTEVENLVGRVDVETRTALKALDTAKFNVAFLKEAGREGMFYFLSGDYSALVAVDTSEGLYIVADDTASTAGAWVRVFSGDRINVMWFGANRDGATTDTSILRNAYLTIGALGGGTLYCPRGTYALASQFLLDDSNISVVGDGPGQYHDAVLGVTDYATRFLWTGTDGGGTTMVQIAPTAGASSPRISGGGLIDIGLYADNGTTAASNCLIMRSAFHMKVAVWVQGMQTYGVYLGVQSTLGEAKDLQHCEIDIRGLELTTGAAANIVYIDGDSVANVSYNRFWIYGAYRDTTAVVVDNSDHNVFEEVWLFRNSGSALGVDVLGGTTTATSARRNYFMQLNAGGGGIQFRGTEAHTVASTEHWIFMFDEGNGQPAVVLGTGCQVVVFNEDGTASGFKQAEKVTFTPVFVASGSTFSYSYQRGQYQQDGDKVTFMAELKLNTSGNTLTANALTVTLTGLPNSAATYVTHVDVSWQNSTTAYVRMAGAVGPGGNTVTLYASTAASTNGLAGVNASAALHATNGSIIRIVGSYFV